MENTARKFLKPVIPIDFISQTAYDNVKSQLNGLNAFNKLCDLSYYIIDYYQKNFYDVSTNPLFLSGYTRDEVIKLGFEFYSHAIYKPDLPLIFKLNNAGFKFFYKLKPERRKHATISYNFRLKHKQNGSLTMINHQLTPLFLNNKNNIWMAICKVSLSNHNESGDVYITLKDDNSRFNFNREEEAFTKIREQKLSRREMEVLKYIAFGEHTNTISEKFKISESTVKNHKSKILKKLNASTSAEAVFFAGKKGLI